jgi:3-oxoacyl-[acyl-carrier-protein] synthase-3
MFFPSTACQVQRQIGAKNATCMDVNAACSGFLYCVEIANQFISNHGCETVLVIGADKLSSIVNWQDRNTCVLFGDGAGAAILRHRPGSKGVVTTYMGSDGNYGDILHMPGGGCALPITRDNVDDKLNTLQMNGRETFKQAVTSMMRAANTVLDRCGLTAQDIKCVIPHQANIRIIEAMADRMDLTMDRFHINLDKYGNTSAAAVAIALDEAARTGRFEKGDPILLVVFGGGLTFASSVIEW